MRRATARAPSTPTVPVRRWPISTSTSILSALPAAAAAASSSATASALSATAISPWAPVLRAARRRILPAAVIGEVTSTLSMPPPAMTSASPTVAQQTPSAPASTCRRAMASDL